MIYCKNLVSLDNFQFFSFLFILLQISLQNRKNTKTENKNIKSHLLISLNSKTALGF